MDFKLDGEGREHVRGWDSEKVIGVLKSWGAEGLCVLGYQSK